MKVVVMNNAQIECLLAKQGFKKFYKNQFSSDGDDFVFDKKFISILDKYLGGEENRLTKSQYNNIKMFVEFGESEIDINHKDYDALVKFDQYLGSL